MSEENWSWSPQSSDGTIMAQVFDARGNAVLCINPTEDARIANELASKIALFPTLLRQRSALLDVCKKVYEFASNSTVWGYLWHKTIPATLRGKVCCFRHDSRKAIDIYNGRIELSTGVKDDN